MLISKLEQKEMELIERLQNTQSLQKSAFEDLEKALQSWSHLTCLKISRSLIGSSTWLCLKLLALQFSSI